LDLVADFRGLDDPLGVVVPLAELDGPFALVADVDQDRLAIYAANATGHQVVLPNGMALPGQPFRPVFPEDGSKLFLHLVLGEGAFQAQVAVRHEKQSSTRSGREARGRFDGS